MAFLIYGKRTGLKDADGQPVFDKTFRALNWEGVRVNKLVDAMAYATKEDAQERINTTNGKKWQEQGLVVLEIRRAR